MRMKIWAAIAFVVSLTLPRAALAFCGFYVSGADGKLFNNATLVVMMREGQRTVLSMQNNYQGPPQNFAMVVPVPQILQKENVKTLPRAIFDRVDQLAAPRLVEYWEQDPCAPPVMDMMMPMSAAAPMGAMRGGSGGGGLGVKIEAQFTVGEYEILILSAKDSGGLDTWLRREKYNIPEGAEPMLRPYVASGMKFFVAKVDASKVKFENGMAMLSPLRFHYDTDTFALPVRLGLLNSAGTQDLIVHILGRVRYEVANYANVTIPTNLDVDEKARGQFGAFYAALFDRTLEKNPHAVVTEYAWDASSCDPCPTPALTPQEVTTLGGDALEGAVPGGSPGGRFGGGGMGGYGWGGFTLTRLHVRYSKDSLGEDLVFRTAPAIAGGREVRVVDNKLEHGASPANGMNNFQGRYAIRHPWTGAIACKEPHRGVWGGPPSGTAGDSTPKPATNLAFAPRGGVQLASFVRADDVPELALATTPNVAPLPAPPPQTPGSVSTGAGKPSGGCAGCSAGRGGETTGAGLLAGMFALGFVARRRRRA